MNGQALTYYPSGAIKTTPFPDGTPSLDFLQQAVGGWIEIIPDFNWIEHRGAWLRCVAFCNEDGKTTEGVLLNNGATILWDRALRRARDAEGTALYPNGLLRSDGNPVDVLLGPIVVLTGDDEFMESL